MREAAPLIAALEGAWAEIRQRHPDVPPAFVITGSGSDSRRRGELRLGHYASDRWRSAGEGEGLAEMFIGGEGLAEGAREVFGTLLHEAAHGVADTRGVKDTSRQGRYHNRRYKALAEELGLEVYEQGDIGWSGTNLTPATSEAYAATIDELDKAITRHRRAESAGDDDEDKPRSNNAIACVCSCEPPRRIRVAAGVLGRGPIDCQICAASFEPVDQSDAEEAADDA